MRYQVSAKRLVLVLLAAMACPLPAQAQDTAPKADSTVVQQTAPAGASTPASTSSQDPMPVSAIRSYDSKNKSTNFLLGEMQLSMTSAVFHHLNDQMVLELAGTKKYAKNTIINGDAVIYKVVNADKFWAANRYSQGFCVKPIQWLAIQDLGKSDDKWVSTVMEGSIRVIMLSGDWQADNPEVCNADTFELDPSVNP